MVLRFGPYRLDSDQRLLLRDEAVVPLEPKIIETLIALVEGRGRLVSKDELLERVWPDAFVEEGSVARNVSALRKALGDDTDSAKYIETIPKRGYRFVARVETETCADAIAPVRDDTPNRRSLQPPVRSAETGPRGARVRSTVAVVTAMLLAVGGITWRYSRVARWTAPALVLSDPVHVTAAEGVEEQPAWSPDARMLAFSSNASGNPASSRWDIGVVEAGGGTPVNRTAVFGGRNQFPTWSPDGTRIAFWSDRDGGGCFVMSALAGAPRKVADASPLDPNPPQWSADGRTLACVAGTGDALAVTVTTVDSGESVLRVPLPGEGRRSYITRSPDGRALAFVTSPAGLSADVNQLWVMSTRTGRTSSVTEGWTRIGSASWSADGRTLFYVSNHQGSMDLWKQEISDSATPVGTSEPVTAGVMMRDAAVAPDGSRIAYSQGRRVANVWRVPVLQNRAATWADAQQITGDEAHIESVDVSPDGLWLAVDSDRGGSRNLWLVPATGGEMRRLTNGSHFEWGPRWSRDGQRLVFWSYRSGNRDIWTMPAAGGAWTHVTKNPGPDLLASWSPDGSAIAHTSVVDGVAGLWVTASNGGASRLLTALPEVSSDWAPDGTEIVFVSHEHMWLAHTNEGPPLRGLATGPVGTPRWSRDGSRIFAVGAAEREGNFYAVAHDGSGERKITNFVGRRGAPGPNALAADDRYLYFTWDEDVGDLWVMNVNRRHDH